MFTSKFVILTDENIGKNIVEQLRAKGVQVDRVEDVLGKGTLDPTILEYAHENGYALLTYDESILQHITDRFAENKNHHGVFIVSHHLQGDAGIGRIVTEVEFYDQSIKGDAASVENDVYNKIIRIK